MKYFPNGWKWIERMLDELQMFMIDSYQRRKTRKITKYAWGSKNFSSDMHNPKSTKNTSFILDKEKKFFFFLNVFLYVTVGKEYRSERKWNESPCAKSNKKKIKMLKKVFKHLEFVIWSLFGKKKASLDRKKKPNIPKPNRRIHSFGRRHFGTIFSLIFFSFCWIFYFQVGVQPLFY